MGVVIRGGLHQAPRWVLLSWLIWAVLSLSVGGGIGSSQKGELRNPRSARSFRPYKVAARRALTSHRREIDEAHLASESSE
jgi:hypothetical protein